MTKELITPRNYAKIHHRLEELLVRCWKMSRPLYPRMRLDFRVFPTESYFSTAGQIWWVTPFWRGDVFALSILFHEGHHWNIYPVDIFRSLKEVFEARKLLAEEIGFKPEIKHRSMWITEEDWSKFGHPVEEFQFVENILGDYLINLHIHDNYPTIWNDLWHFLAIEGTFYSKEKALKRDTTFLLYIAVYPELVPGLSKIQVQEQASIDKIPKIAKVIRECRTGRVSTIYALKELIKLFHENIMNDFKEGQEGGEGKEGKMECPKCHTDGEWEITAYQNENGSWTKI